VGVSVAVQMIAVGRGPGGEVGSFVNNHPPASATVRMLTNKSARHPHCNKLVDPPLCVITGLLYLRNGGLGNCSVLPGDGSSYLYTLSFVKRQSVKVKSKVSEPCRCLVFT